MATIRVRQAVTQGVRKIPMRPMIASRQRTPAPAQGLKRKLPGSSGTGHYYHIEVRKKSDFVAFWTEDVGRRGHALRVAGKRPTGTWVTVQWLIGKADAHIQNGTLVADSKDAREVLKQLGSQPVHKVGDRFKARPRPKTP